MRTYESLVAFVLVHLRIVCYFVVETAGTTMMPGRKLTGSVCTELLGDFVPKDGRDERVDGEIIASLYWYF